MLTQDLPIFQTVPEDAESAVAALTMAFGIDPVCRWAWPDPAQYLQAFPQFIRAFGGAAFGVGGAFHAPAFCGAALWLPPESGPDDEALSTVFERTISPEKLSALGEMFEKMAAYHPAEPHWHLPLIGVEPRKMGQGLGSALLAAGLARCDELGMVAYLESTNPRNQGLYERFGFRPMGEIRSGDSPPIVPMVRPARQSQVRRPNARHL